MLLSKLKTKFNTSPTKKEEIYLVPYLGYQKKRYYYYVSLKVKIGKEKMYSFFSKMHAFLLAYENGEEYRFGSSFTYDPKRHYLSEKSLRLLELLKELKEGYAVDGNMAILSEKHIKKLLHICQDGIYLDDEQTYLKVIQGFPYQIDFTKKEKKYYLTFQGKIEELKPLTEDFEYILYKNTIYHLNKEEQFLLSECKEMQLSEIVFPEELFADFQKNLIRIVKDKVVLDESTKDIIIDFKPEVGLYFDLNEDHITCIPKFTYKDKTISYFDEVDALVRDEEYENQVIQDLYEYGFHKMSKFFLLDDFDCVCEFMSGNLDELTEKYPVFTSEKIKNTKFVKNNQITTTFKIGQDNILKYDFDLGVISKDEIKQVLNSLHQKKKYFRLKSGDILSLENDDLRELEELTQELEMSQTDLSNAEGTIPKYRALYLDSVKKSRYHIVKTDSLFDDFINQFKKYKETKIEFSKTQEKILRDYQKEGVQWLYTIYKCGFGGILADEMGLGKSLQTIYFIQKLLEEDPESRFLIVCPTSLVYNWEKEFEKFAPKLSYKVFSGSKNNRKKELTTYEGNIYITSYGLLREDLDIYQEKNFKVMIIDEAQNIKNPTAGLTKATKSIHAQTKMALTGTPIENSVVELWSIFDFIMPGFLSSLLKFQQKYKVKDFDEETNNLLNHLKEQVRPFILRRKKNDVIAELPEKIENNIFIDLKEEQKKIYAAEVLSVEEKMNEMISNGGFAKSKMMILSLLTRLRQICIDPGIVLEDYTGGSSKLENLIEILKEVTQSGHKVLLFTSFKTALEKVKDLLDEEGISNYTIAGDVPSKKRQMLVDAFNKDQTSVFLIMLKSGGTGLNLTSADIVIHLDLWWNPQAEAQATDRTHRIGQTKNVEVIKLICKGTIEEKILELQKKKKILSDKILSGEMDDSSYLNSLNEEDIRMLISSENKD